MQLPVRLSLASLCLPPSLTKVLLLPSNFSYLHNSLLLLHLSALSCLLNNLLHQ
jgi:hypothetical protein